MTLPSLLWKPHNSGNPGEERRAQVGPSRYGPRTLQVPLQWAKLLLLRLLAPLAGFLYLTTY